MIRLLGRTDSLNVRKVLWAMDELGVTCKSEDYGGPFGKVSTPEYRELNPHGLVPTLIDGENVVWESNTIIRYLAERASQKSFGGAEAATRARVSQWMDWQLGTLNPPLQTLFVQLVRVEENKRDKRIVDESVSIIHRLLDTLTSVLPSRGFLLGDDITAADVCIGVMLHRYITLISVESVQAPVRQYFSELATREGFQARVAIGAP